MIEYAHKEKKMENLSFVKIATDNELARIQSLESNERLNQNEVDTLVQEYRKNSSIENNYLFVTAR